MAFHLANPHVFNNFKKLANKAYNSGMTKYSARTIMEVMRWKYDVDSREYDNSFKLSNDLTPMYARLLINENKKFDNFFTTHK